MIGQYTTEVILNMTNIVSSVKQYNEGYICRIVSKTINHYKRESDGSWTNYKCNTKG